MDTSKPSPRNFPPPGKAGVNDKGKGTGKGTGKRTGTREKSDALRHEAYQIALTARDDAKPFGSQRGGETILNARGKAIDASWRELAAIRPFLEPDVLMIGPRRVQGILLFKAKGPEFPTLADAVKLFKVLSSLRLAQLGKTAAAGRNPFANSGPGPKVASDPARRAAAPSALWKKGFTEKPISGSADLAEQRKALKGLQAR
ncbi:MAG: hypothetical protein ABIW76_11345 [Fibrobacteria bacterium]